MGYYKTISFLILPRSLRKADKDGGSLSVCKILINNQDFYCVAHDNSHIINQVFASGLLSVNRTVLMIIVVVP